MAGLYDKTMFNFIKTDKTFPKNVVPFHISTSYE